MKEFDPHLILQQCCPLPFSDDKKIIHEGKTFYGMILPQACCCWSRGFYFQPMILEFSFREYSPGHSSKTTFIFIRWRENENKRIIGLEGDANEYPVLAFYICVNRDNFQPLGNQNKIEWFNSTAAPRTSWIAHELLYADQYAKYWDPAREQIMRPLEIPTVDQEEELLCPPSKIQKSISTFNQFIDGESPFISEQEFLRQQSTEIVQGYYAHWLEQFGVNRDICHKRTCLYLKMQAKHPIVEKILDGCAKNHKIPLKELDGLKFKQHAKGETDFFKEFISEVEKSGFGYSKTETINHAILVLEKKNGHG